MKVSQWAKRPPAPDREFTHEFIHIIEKRVREGKYQFYVNPINRNLYIKIKPNHYLLILKKGSSHSKDAMYENNPAWHTYNPKWKRLTPK